MLNETPYQRKWMDFISHCGINWVYCSRWKEARPEEQEKSELCAFFPVLTPPPSCSTVSQLDSTWWHREAFVGGCSGEKISLWNQQQQEILSECGCCNRAKGERRCSWRRHSWAWGLGWLSSDHWQKGLTTKSWLYLVPNAETTLCLIIPGL